MTLEEAKNLATNGNIEAALLLGKYYLDQDETSDAIEWFEIAAEDGHMGAMAVLVPLYMNQGHTRNTKMMRQFCGTRNVRDCFLSAYKWGSRVLPFFDDTTTKIGGKTKEEMTAQRDEAAYYAALYSYICDENESALELIPDIHDERTDILRGVLLLEKDGERYKNEGFKLLSKIRNNRAFGESNKDEFEDYVYTQGALYLSLFCREGWVANADINAALDILKFVRGYVKDEEAQARLDKEINRYQPKFFGGYKYV